jgi:hypothetical protein
MSDRTTKEAAAMSAETAIDQAPEEIPEEREADMTQMGGDQEIAAAPEEKSEEKDVVDILKPKAEVKVWRIGKDDYAREYVQRPLSFVKKMQWFSLVGEVLDKALSGPSKMSLNSLFSAPGARGGLTMEDFRDADTFVQAVGKLLVHAPDFLVKSYCIWLNIPDFEQDVAARIMEMSPEEGGLTDQDGVEMIEIFIDQNYEALDRFFREDLSKLQGRVAARQKDAADHRQSPLSRR